jgi:hypothetical protein
VHNAPKLGCAFREYAHELHSCNTNGLMSQLDFTLRDQNHSATDSTLYSSTLVATSSDVHLLGTPFCASETRQITGIPPPLHAVEQRTLYLLTFIHYSGRIGTFGRRFNCLLRAFDLDGMDNPLLTISKPMKRRIDYRIYFYKSLLVQLLHCLHPFHSLTHNRYKPHRHLAVQDLTLIYI